MTEKDNLFVGIALAGVAGAGVLLYTMLSKKKEPSLTQILPSLPQTIGKCPFGDWTGPIEKLMEHLATKHNIRKAIFDSQGNLILFINTMGDILNDKLQKVGVVAKNNIPVIFSQFSSLLKKIIDSKIDFSKMGLGNPVIGKVIGDGKLIRAIQLPCGNYIDPFGVALTKTINGKVTALTPAVQNMLKSFNINLPVIQEAIKPVQQAVTFTQQVASQIPQQAQQVAQQIPQQVQQATQQVGQQVQQSAQQAISGVSTAVQPIISTITTGAQQAVSGITSGIQDITQQAQQAGTQLIQNLPKPSWLKFGFEETDDEETYEVENPYHDGI
ncbi:hypothetical protein [Caldisericum sp.]|uniref:hypothetical protein n=1 Tax=Caldisericum sp. TaxID=2499687 RepID=UPI003D0F4675